MARLKAPAWIGGGALALWLWIGVGFANYDTLFALVWGQQLGRGETPTYSLPIAPTPHPLLTVIGLVLSPLGPGATEDLVVALAYVMLSALGYVVYRLGTAWFGWPVGLLAATIVLTREPILSYGVRVYADVPYVVLVLSALLVETRRRHAGWPVLALLGLAGLLRPEAWLFAAAYWVWLWMQGGRSGADLLRLGLLVLAPPVLWAASDLLVTGNPAWSFTKTRDTAATLHRVRGLQNVPITGSRRVGEVLREPVVVGAALGGILSLLWLRERVKLAIVAGVVAVVGFCVLAIGGLPLVTRYVFVIAVLLAIFAAAGALGWWALQPGDPRRRQWQVGSVVIAAGLAAFIPSQVHRLDHTFDALGRQQRIQNDLVALVDGHQLTLRCGPVGVPNHRPVPLLALRLQTRPSNVVSAQTRSLSRGSYVDPASGEVRRDYTLDPNDPHLLLASVPPGFAPAGGDSSWRIFTRCT